MYYAIPMQKRNQIKRFTELNVWKEAHKLVLIVYNITKKFPIDERFSLVQQMRRAVVSITSNIAEGFGRKTGRDKIKFYYYSSGSLIELMNQCIISRDLNLLSMIEFEELWKQQIIVQKLLSGLIKAAQNFI